MTTSPLLPRAPTWMCAAVTGPESCLNVSFQESWLPSIVAVKRPEAPSFVPFGFGFAWPVLSAADAASGAAFVVSVLPLSFPFGDLAASAPVASDKTAAAATTPVTRCLRVMGLLCSFLVRLRPP